MVGTALDFQGAPKATGITNKTLTMYFIYDKFLLTFFPDQYKGLTPYFNTLGNDWIIGSEWTGQNPYFRTQFVQCFYPVSGSYGSTSRIVYYLAIVIALIARRRIGWLAYAALGLVMTYSSTAAIHALILVIVRKEMAPDDRIDLPRSEKVQVQGNWTPTYEGSPLGYTHYAGNSQLWLPLIPMVYDRDADPVLTIVGTAFLILLPMQIWSSTVRSAREKGLLVLWGLLLFMGLVCALINEDFVQFWYYNQLRFCPPDREDQLPFPNVIDNDKKHAQHYQDFAGPWKPGNFHRWHQVIGDVFVHKNRSMAEFPNACIYPCFEFNRWPVRDSQDIWAGPPRDWGNFNPTTWLYLLIVAYILVILSCLSSMTVLVVMWWPRLDHWKNVRPAGVFSRARSLWNTDGASHSDEENPDARLKDGLFRRVRRRVFVVWMVCVYFFAFVISPLAVTFFVVFFEWKLWEFDREGRETMNHIGQWGLIVTAVLVIVAGLFAPAKERWGPRVKESVYAKMGWRKS